VLLGNYLSAMPRMTKTPRSNNQIHKGVMVLRRSSHIPWRSHYHRAMARLRQGIDPVCTVLQLTTNNLIHSHNSYSKMCYNIVIHGVCSNKTHPIDRSKTTVTTETEIMCPREVTCPHRNTQSLPCRPSTVRDNLCKHSGPKICLESPKSKLFWQRTIKPPTKPVAPVFKLPEWPESSDSRYATLADPVADSEPWEGPNKIPQVIVSDDVETLPPVDLSIIEIPDQFAPRTSLNSISGPAVAELADAFAGISLPVTQIEAFKATMRNGQVSETSTSYEICASEAFGQSEYSSKSSTSIPDLVACEDRISAAQLKLKKSMDALLSSQPTVAHDTLQHRIDEIVQTKLESPVGLVVRVTPAQNAMQDRVDETCALETREKRISAVQNELKKKMEQLHRKGLLLASVSSTTPGATVAAFRRPSYEAGPTQPIPASRKSSYSASLTSWRKPEESAIISRSRTASSPSSAGIALSRESTPSQASSAEEKIVVPQAAPSTRPSFPRQDCGSRESSNQA
jgi:hypothetical protein